MINKLFVTFLFVVGVINFLPVIGVFSANQLAAAYGVDLNSHELIILMRHRALLFGLLGGLVFWSLFNRPLRLPAMIFSGISMVGFLVLAWPMAELNEPVFRVFLVDVVGIICLAIAVLLKWLANNDTERSSGEL